MSIGRQLIVATLASLAVLLLIAHWLGLGAF
jgi:hypothetical protein